jgi:hypothetical protein
LHLKHTCDDIFESGFEVSNEFKGIAPGFVSIDCRWLVKTRIAMKRYKAKQGPKYRKCALDNGIIAAFITDPIIKSIIM